MPAELRRKVDVKMPARCVIRLGTTATAREVRVSLNQGPDKHTESAERTGRADPADCTSIAPSTASSATPVPHRCDKDCDQPPDLCPDRPQPSSHDLCQWME
jgi:hypothetical protein